MINFFYTFVDFANYMGMIKAIILVVSFYVLTGLLTKLPEHLAHSNNKVAKILLTKI